MSVKYPLFRSSSPPPPSPIHANLSIRADKTCPSEPHRPQQTCTSSSSSTYALLAKYSVRIISIQNIRVPGSTVFFLSFFLSFSLSPFLSFFLSCSPPHIYSITSPSKMSPEASHAQVLPQLSPTLSGNVSPQSTSQPTSSVPILTTPHKPPRASAPTAAAASTATQTTARTQTYPQVKKAPGHLDVRPHDRRKQQRQTHLMLTPPSTPSTSLRTTSFGTNTSDTSYATTAAFDADEGLTRFLKVSLFIIIICLDSPHSSGLACVCLAFEVTSFGLL